MNASNTHSGTVNTNITGANGFDAHRVLSPIFFFFAVPLFCYTNYFVEYILPMNITTTHSGIVNINTNTGTNGA
jgi:hypothetical protein